MTTEVRNGEWVCDHDPAGVCWLCSDQVSWWAELRAKRGVEKVERPVIIPLVLGPRCMDCGTATSGHGKRCLSCARVEVWRTSRHRERRQAYMRRVGA